MFKNQVIIIILIAVFVSNVKPYTIFKKFSAATQESRTNFNIKLPKLRCNPACSSYNHQRKGMKFTKQCELNIDSVEGGKDVCANKYSSIKNKNSITINPFKDCNKYINKNVNSFKSVWIKCLSCLAISDKINTSFVEVHKEINLFTDEFNENIQKALIKTCQNGFKNYDLREYKGTVIVTKTSIYSKHVSSEIDGNWNKLLSEICLKYIKNMNYRRLLNEYLMGYLKFDDFLCRSGGLYRDCENLILEYFQVPDNYGSVTLRFCVKPN
nr:uncharacterized protein LOC111429504 [Onthophagus taurus]